MIRKYKILRDANKYRVFMKRRLIGSFSPFGWEKVDYFFSEGDARKFVESMNNPILIMETEWIKT